MSELIPCYVIVFNTPLTWLIGLCSDLVRIGFEVHILNNCSTYSPLIEWLNSCPYTVHNLSVNYGHLSLWDSGIINTVINPYFALTDGDLDLSTLPLTTIDKFKSGIVRFNCGKCGSALKINDIPDEFPAKSQTLEYESNKWCGVGDDFYNAGIDTTFALYQTNKFKHAHAVGGVRVGGEFEAKHLSWYITPSSLDTEIAYYLDTSDINVSTVARLINPTIREWKINE